MHTYKSIVHEGQIRRKVESIKWADPGTLCYSAQSRLHLYLKIYRELLEKIYIQLASNYFSLQGRVEARSNFSSVSVNYNSNMLMLSRQCKLCN